MIPEDVQIPEIVKSRKSSTYMTRPRTTQLLPYDNWNDMYRGLRFSIKKEFRRHQELLESKALSEMEKQYFLRVLNEEVSEVECQNALGELAFMLSLHYERKVIIIIDEYDTPIQQGHLNGYYDQVTGFMRNLFSAALKDNENLEFGILTGILRVAKESLFSGLNNLVVNTILDEKYASYFGFTDDEVLAITDIMENQALWRKSESGMMDICLEDRKYIIHGLC